MSRLLWILTLVLAVFSTTAVYGAAPPTETELKERFIARHDTLRRLKDASKVGETTKGFVEIVDAEYAGESITLPDRRTMTVTSFVRAENDDRRRLYRLIAERTDETVAVVAEQAAIRHFRRASPEHLLKLETGQWVRKKDLPEPQA